MENNIKKEGRKKYRRVREKKTKKLQKKRMR
jgi:hypothetical protein